MRRKSKLSNSEILLVRACKKDVVSLNSLRKISAKKFCFPFGSFSNKDISYYMLNFIQEHDLKTNLVWEIVKEMGKASVIWSGRVKGINYIKSKTFLEEDEIPETHWEKVISACINIIKFVEPNKYFLNYRSPRIFRSDEAQNKIKVRAKSPLL